MAKKYNIEEMSPQEMIAEAQKLLEAAGTDASTAEEMLFIGGVAAAQTILTHPDPQKMAAYMAENNPNAAKTAYDELNKGFNELGAPPPGMSMAGFSDPGKPPSGGFQTNEEGTIRYNNGVLYNPEQGVIYPHNDPEAVGSQAWLLNIQKTWDQSKVETWRKRLNEFGYEVAEKGGFDQTFITALTQYHNTRYMNGGKPLPVDQNAGLTRKDWGGALDPAVMRGEVRTWFQEAYGEDPTDDELKFWADKLAQTSRRIARKQGLDPSAAVGVAHARTQEAFRSTPEAKEFARQEEDEEENTELRDSLLSVSQIVGL